MVMEPFKIKLKTGVVKGDGILTQGDSFDEELDYDFDEDEFNDIADRSLVENQREDATTDHESDMALGASGSTANQENLIMNNPSLKKLYKPIAG